MKAFLCASCVTHLTAGAIHRASTFEWAESFRQYLNPECLVVHYGNPLETFVSFRLCWSWTVYQLHPSAWHCNGSLMGCSACLNALLNPGAIWWGMRFWFLAVRLKLRQKWNEKEKKKINERYRGTAKTPLWCLWERRARRPSALPSHVTWVTLCLVWHPNTPAVDLRRACRALGRLTGSLGV